MKRRRHQRNDDPIDPSAPIMDVVRNNLMRLIGDEHGRRSAIARAAEMSPSQLTDLLHSRRKNTGIVQVSRLARALGVEEMELFDKTYGREKGLPSVGLLKRDDLLQAFQEWMRKDLVTLVALGGQIKAKESKRNS